MGTTSALKSSSQYTSSTINTYSSPSVLKIRGGAAPLDPNKPKVVVSTATALAGAQGFVSILCSEAKFKAYCTVASKYITDGNNVMVGEKIEYMQLISVVTVAMLVFYGIDGKTALAYDLLTHIIMFGANVINKTPMKTGYDSVQNKIWMVIDAVLAYGLLNNSTWSTSAYKTILFLRTINYIMMRIDPFQWLQLHGGEKALDPLTVSLYRSYADVGLSNMVFFFALISGIDILTSIAYSWIAFGFSLFIRTFVSKQFDVMNDPSLNVWCAGWLFVIASDL